MRIELTAKGIEKLKAPAPGERTNYWDSLVPSLCLRVTHTGRKSFVIQRRVNGRMVRVKLGDFPTLKLADARETARTQIKEMSRGRIPSQIAATASTLRTDSFEAAVEDYIKREVEKNRRPRTQKEIVRPLRKISSRSGAACRSLRSILRPSWPRSTRSSTPVSR